jgi:RNA polymerase sigma factor (sigma-70 family)
VDLVRAGHRDAFGALYRKYVMLVRRVVSSNLHDADAVADVVQDTFARALENLSSLRDPARFRPWLLAIARHVAVDRRRALAREGIFDDDWAAGVPSTTSGPEELAEVRELSRLVQVAMSELSARDAAAVAMVTYLGFAPSDLAPALGVSISAAKVIVHRARRRLRNALALQVMVRHGDLACGQFRRLARSRSLVAAARHIGQCRECVAAAALQIQAGERCTPRDPSSRTAHALPPDDYERTARGASLTMLT